MGQHPGTKVAEGGLVNGVSRVSLTIGSGKSVVGRRMELMTLLSGPKGPIRGLSKFRTPQVWLSCLQNSCWNARCELQATMLQSKDPVIHHYPLSGQAPNYSIRVSPVCNFTNVLKYSPIRLAQVKLASQPLSTPQFSMFKDFAQSML